MANGGSGCVYNGSIVLSVVNEVNISNTLCRDLRFINSNISRLSVSSHFAVYGVTVRYNTGGNVFPISRGALRCMGNEDRHRCGIFRTSRSTRCGHAVAISLSALGSAITFPRLPRGAHAFSSVPRVGVSRIIVNSYAGNEVRSVHVTTSILGNGGITGGIHAVVVPTARRVCLRYVGRNLTRVFVRTNTVISAPAYKPYLNNRVNVLTGNRGTISASGEGFMNEVNRARSRVCLTSPTITTTSTVGNYVTSPTALWKNVNDSRWDGERHSWVQ